MPGRPPDPTYSGGRGSPLVLLHGALGTWRIWRRVLPILEQEHAVFAPTLAGHHGAAPLADGIPPSVAALTDFVGRQLDEHGLDTAHVSGNSLGGWIALELARRGRARSVVAFSPAGAWRGRADMQRLSLAAQSAALLRRLGPQARWLVRRRRTRGWLLQPVTDVGDRLDPSEVLEALDAASACTIVPGLIAEARRHGPLAPGMDRVDCHIRLAWGERDRVLPFDRHGRPLLDLLPAAELVLLPGVGHAPMLDDPDLTARTILEVSRQAAPR